MTTFDKNSLIVEYASLLAERELIEKYNLLPTQLRNDEGQYFDKYQGEFDEQYDIMYAQLTKLSQLALQNKIDSMWSRYVLDNGGDPKFTACQIQYIDTPHESQEVKIKISDDNDKDSDDDIFFYCTSLVDLKSLVESGSGDFKIIEIFSFTPTP